MTLLLQESGGLRATAPVQSPLPIRAAHRLSPVQRFFVLLMVLTLIGMQVLNAVYATLDWLPARAEPVPALPSSPALDG